MDGIAETSAPAIPARPSRRRFDVTEFHRMAEVGIFTDDARLELIDGEIIDMHAIGGPHIRAAIVLNRLLVLAAGARFIVSTQNSLRLDSTSAPEPDLVLLSPRAAHRPCELPPLAEDALLVIEVSHSSLRYDREIKLPLYARHGIPEVWIVDLAAGEIEVCRAPADGAYTDVTRAGRGETVSPLALPEARISVADVVPVTPPRAA
jgi:Uma2 family endonuclease